jgi:hypothetical protein
MRKPGAMLLVACFMAAINPVLAQDAGGYQSSAPVWPQQAPQGYEAPQLDAYRGQAQMQGAAPASTNFQQQQQPFQPDSASRAMTEQQPMGDKPIKAAKPPSNHHLLGTVGGIGRTLGHVAMPVAGLGAVYMVTRAASRSGMMGGMGMGMPMGGMGTGGMGMGGYGYGGGGYGYGGYGGGMRMPGYGW